MVFLLLWDESVLAQTKTSQELFDGLRLNSLQDIHVPLRMKCENFGNPLTLIYRTSQNFSVYPVLWFMNIYILAILLPKHHCQALCMLNKNSYPTQSTVVPA